MATSPMMSIANAIAALNAVTANFNNCYINIYTGAIPASCKVASSGTILSYGMRFGATAFPTAVDSNTTGLAVATANAISSDTGATGTGTAGYFRVETGQNTGTVEAQGTCGTSAADMILNTTTITAGDIIACSSFVINLPDGSGVD